MLDANREALNLAYIAGIIDGEGSITISKENHGKYVSFTAQLGIANSQPLLIAWLQQFFDCGYIVKRTPTQNQTHNRPIDRALTQRTMYWWIVRSRKAVKEVLPKVYPYLFLKKRQAKLCLILQTIRDSIPMPTKETRYYRFIRQPIELLEIKAKIRDKVMEANHFVM